MTDKLWAQYGAGRGVLHLGCFRERLGRAMRPEDFPTLPINDTIRAALTMEDPSLEARVERYRAAWKCSFERSAK